MGDGLSYAKSVFIENLADTGERTYINLTVKLFFLLSSSKTKMGGRYDEEKEEHVSHFLVLELTVYNKIFWGTSE